MGKLRYCPQCGSAMPADTLEGHCPRCLANIVLGQWAKGAPVGGLPASSPATPAETRSSTLALPLTEKPGDKIGHYKLLQQIGEGGCGVVYMAEQEEPIRRRVALKVIKVGMDTRQVIARFEAERQALALMDHPNIARVLDAGSTDTGRPYFVMELVRGIKITDYCDQNNLSTAARLELFMQVCHAIQHAHQKGIIHRDIKPSNILVTLHDGVPVPKVIDFGIAKATQQKLTEKTLFTAFEQFIGTPAYMSPEQAEMSGLDIDTRSDVYALGVLLYELLTGHTPFDARTLIEAGLDEMRRIIREQEPVRPSTRISSLAAAEQTTVARRRQLEAPRLVHLVRGDLDWIVMKCLEKNRTRRYETANGLAQDLQRHLVHDPVEARPPSRTYRFQRLVRRNQLVFAAAGAVTAALVIGLGLSTYLFLKERDSRRRAETAERTQAQLTQKAEANEKRARAAASKSEQVAQFLQEMLESVGPSVAQGKDTKLLREILDRTAERVGKDLTSQPEVEADLRTTLGQVYRELAAYDRAEAMHVQALALRTNLWGTEHTNVATSLDDLAHVLWRAGRIKEAEARAVEALAIRQKLLPPVHSDIALSLNNLSTLVFDQGKMAEAQEFQRRALEMRRKLYPGDHQDVAESLDNLASLLSMVDKFAEADPMAREALAMRRRLFTGDHVAVAQSLNSLAALLARWARPAEAEPFQREALAMRRRLFGNEHPDVALALSNLATMLDSQGKYAEAGTMAQEALAMRRKLFGKDHMDVRESLNNLAVVYQHEGRLAEAETAQREELQLARAALGTNHWRVASSMNNLAIVLRDEGKLTEAELLQREALETQVRVLGREHQAVAISLNNLGRVLRMERKYREAEEAHRQALVVFKKALGEDHPVRVGVINDLALAVELQGRLAELENQLRECLAFGETKMTNSWLIANTRSLLGGCLVEQRKFTEAEPLLQAGYEQFKKREKTLPADCRPRVREAAQRLARFYEATGHPDQAANYRRASSGADDSANATPAQ